MKPVFGGFETRLKFIKFGHWSRNTDLSIILSIISIKLKLKLKNNDWRKPKFQLGFSGISMFYKFKFRISLSLRISRNKSEVEIHVTGLNPGLLNLKLVSFLNLVIILASNLKLFMFVRKQISFSPCQLQAYSVIPLFYFLSYFLYFFLPYVHIYYLFYLFSLNFLII